MQITATQIAAFLGGIIEGNPDTIITQPARIEEATQGSICFLAHPKYYPYAYTTAASALLVGNDFVPESPITATLIRVADVRMAVAALLEHYGTMQAQNSKTKREIHAQTAIASSAKIADGVVIGAFTEVGEGATISEGCVLQGQVFVGENVVLGKNVQLYSGVRIYHDCVIGDNCIIHSNTVIGSDGFGFVPQADGTFKKVPQIGNVIIENNVEIGANTVIDRATMGSTILRAGVKLDNLIQIAHNVEIGENTVIAAQTGIAGSTKIGKNCLIGGQVGIVGHITVADGTKIQAKSGIAKSVKEPNTALAGAPAFDYGKEMRASAVFRRLPELEKQVAALEKILAAKS